jgi:hypothetical protein
MTNTQSFVTIFAVGLLAVSPAIAQTSTITPMQDDSARHRTDSEGSTSNSKPTDATRQTFNKQHTDGGDSPSDPRATDATAAAWRKLHPHDP